MPYSPLVSKIRCHHPNKQKSRICNRNYLVYIATREGVDLSDITYLKIEQQLEELNDTNVSIESANDLYAKYIAERPGSHGLFGNFDITSVNAVANHLADLTSSGKTIYRGIVSLSEKDAKELGYIGDTSKDKWVQFMRASMPDLSKQFNIPIDKLKWTAAVHMEKNHPHCHYMFWHDGEVITNPYIHTSVQHACREILSKEMFKEEREQEQINKTLHRDLLLDTGHKFLEKETSSILSQVTNKSLVMGRINNDTLEGFGKKLLQLSAQLPESGRLNYKLLPPEVKAKVDDFVTDLLQEKEIQKEYLSYLQTADNISRTYSVSQNHFDINHKKADEDIRKRLANTILKSCRNLVREVNIFDKYIDRSELLSEDAAVIDSPEQEPSEATPIENSYDIAVLPDISEYDDIEFQYNWNNEYKRALKLIYDPKTKDILQAVDILKTQASQSNVLACMELGKIYCNELVPSISTHDSQKSGQQYYQKAFAGLLKLEAREPKASYEYKLGKLFEKGYGTSVDYEKARHYYELAAYSENKYAQYSLGSMYLHEHIAAFTNENRTDLIKTGLSYIKQSADQGFAYAAYSFAKTHETESFLHLSPDELKYYYSVSLGGFQKMLAERRDDNLLYRIGTMYYHGQGTDPDQEIAFNYFKEAAELNNVNAQYALGKTYADRESGHFDLDKAIKYLDKAIKKNNIYAMTALGDIYCNPDNELHYDIEKGITHYTNAYEHGNEQAAYKLGSLYSNPELECYHLEKAIKYLDIAADKGNEFACYKLGVIYLDPDSSHFNPDQGLALLNKAIDTGNVYAQAKLGNMYLWGKNPAVKKDVEKGLSLLRQAAAGGNEYAQTSIDIYQDIQNNIGSNLMIKAGYGCFRSAFATLSQHRRSPDPYADPAIRNIGKAARKALATRMGKYVDQNNKKE